MSDENRSPLLEACVTMHEMYETLREAGFTESQALYITAQCLRPQQ